MPLRPRSPLSNRKHTVSYAELSIDLSQKQHNVSTKLPQFSPHNWYNFSIKLAQFLHKIGTIFPHNWYNFSIKLAQFLYIITSSRNNGIIPPLQVRHVRIDTARTSIIHDLSVFIQFSASPELYSALYKSPKRLYTP